MLDTPILILVFGSNKGAVVLEIIAETFDIAQKSLELIFGILVLLIITLLIFHYRKTIQLLAESYVGMAGVVLIAFFVIASCLAPILAPFDPNKNIGRREIIRPLSSHTQEINVSREVRTLMQGPEKLSQQEAVNRIQTERKFERMNIKETQRLRVTGEHDVFLILGSDRDKRDLLSRLIYGGQRVLIYATLATASAYLVGIFLGLAAGYFRGWIDEVISFIANVILSFPVMVLYVVIITQLGASGFNIILAVVFASSPGIMRIVRGLALDLRHREYVAAAQIRGESGLWIMLVEILPNARGPLIVDACLRMGYTTITIGALGFLGLGLPPPDPDWGGMITAGRAQAQTYPHIIIAPAVAISLLVLGFNLLADGLREISLRD